MTYVFGVYDIIVRMSSNDIDELREIIKSDIRKIDKVRSTITMIVTEGQKQRKWQSQHLFLYAMEYHFGIGCSFVVLVMTIDHI